MELPEVGEVQTVEVAALKKTVSMEVLVGVFLMEALSEVVLLVAAVILLSSAAFLLR